MCSLFSHLLFQTSSYCIVCHRRPNVSFKSIFFSLKLLLASLEIISESSDKCDCPTHSTIHNTVDVSFFCIIDNLGDIYATMKRKSSGKWKREKENQLEFSLLIGSRNPQQILSDLKIHKEVLDNIVTVTFVFLSSFAEKSW